jgi:hypothetical protein
LVDEKGEELIVTVKRRVKLRADKWASLDVNLTNVTALINGRGGKV